MEEFASQSFLLFIFEPHLTEEWRGFASTGPQICSETLTRPKASSQKNPKITHIRHTSNWKFEYKSDSSAKQQQMIGCVWHIWSGPSGGSDSGSANSFVKWNADRFTLTSAQLNMLIVLIVCVIRKQERLWKHHLCESSQVGERTSCRVSELQPHTHTPQHPSPRQHDHSGRHLASHWSPESQVGHVHLA